MEMNENEQNVINPVWEQHEGNGMEWNRIILLLLFFVKMESFYDNITIRPLF